MALIAGVQYSGTPAGTIMPCGTSVALPRTLLCNGSAVSRTTYPALFAAIGTAYGAGDGSTTFNLPNMNGVFMRGAGTSLRYTFTVTSANATAGATYTNNSQTFTVMNTISGGTTLIADGTGAPTSSGTLTKATGIGDATITFSAVVALIYSSVLGGYTNDRMQGHGHDLYGNTSGGSSWNLGATPQGVGGGNGGTGLGYFRIGSGLKFVSDPTSDGTNGTPRTGNETAPAHLGVNYCIAF